MGPTIDEDPCQLCVPFLSVTLLSRSLALHTATAACAERLDLSQSAVLTVIAQGYHHAQQAFSACAEWCSCAYLPSQLLKNIPVMVMNNCIAQQCNDAVQQQRQLAYAGAHWLPVLRSGFKKPVCTPPACIDCQSLVG